MVQKLFDENEGHDCAKTIDLSHDVLNTGHDATCNSCKSSTRLYPIGRFRADIWPRKIVIRHTKSPRENLYIVYLIQNLPRNPKMVLDFFKNLIFNSYDVILT